MIFEKALQRFDYLNDNADKMIIKLKQCLQLTNFEHDVHNLDNNPQSNYKHFITSP